MLSLIQIVGVYRAPMWELRCFGSYRWPYHQFKWLFIKDTRHSRRSKNKSIRFSNRRLL